VSVCLFRNNFETKEKKMGKKIPSTYSYNKYMGNREKKERLTLSYANFLKTTELFYF
jgi:hypothetical protein